MRALSVLLLVAACKDSAPPTLAELAEQMCACKDVGCREQVAAKVHAVMSEMAPDQLEAHVKDVERIDNCAKSIAKETR